MRSSRRQFIAGTAGLVLSGLPSTADQDSFACVLFGDTHFDRLEHHDLAYVESKHGPGDVRQIRNYSRLTAQVLPGLFAEVRDVIADSKLRVAMAAHVGDLVEGLCGKPELARKQMQDCIAFVEEAKLGAPLLVTKSNHDITGPGAVEAYNVLLLPFLRNQSVGRSFLTDTTGVASASFSIKCGNALFAFFDAYDRNSLAWLDAVLTHRKAKHVFVVMHPPVVPYAARALWHIYSNPRQQPLRAQLLNLLGKHRAIVLCGHLHKYCVVARATESGRFVQLAVSSVIQSPDAQPAQVRSGLDRYGPDLVKLEPDFDPKSETQRREALQAEAPFIKHFEYADTAGYAILKIEGDSVKADIYVGLGQRLWKTVDLTALLAS